MNGSLLVQNITAISLRWANNCIRGEGMKPLLEKLKKQALYFEGKAKTQTDKYNQGYFEGKEEQNLKIIEAIEADDLQSALEALDS